MVDVEEGAIIVETARAAIEFYLTGKDQSPPSYPSPHLQQPRGAFVTLLDGSRRNALRGCIGSPFPDKPLLLQVAESAVEAATMDPRFNPVSLEELRSRIIIEVTVLTPAEEINVRNPHESRDKIVIGRDGLMVDGGGVKGLLLPQVAVDEGFDSEEFLSQCCIKAGLLPDAWLTGSVRVSRFQGQIFSENKPGGTVSERRLA